MGNRFKDQDSIKSRPTNDEAKGELSDVDAPRARRHRSTLRARARRAAAVTAVTLGALTIPILAAQPAMAAPYTCTSANWNQSVCQSLTPTMNCVWHGAGNSWTAVFGYRNTSATYDITVPVGALNLVAPGGPNAGQPTFFPRGTVTNAFAVSFNPNTAVAWTLVGKVVTARTNSTRCPSPPVPALGSASVMARTLLIAMPLLLVVARTRRVRLLVAGVPTVFRSAA
jgi:hypothetical protein